MIWLIWAQSRDGVIGADGALPWYLPEDLAHFKAVTSGHPVVMGRRTWDSLPPRFRPLPGRLNVVVTRQEGWPGSSVPDGVVLPDGVAVASSVGEALAVAGRAAGAAGEVWVIGGEQIFAATLPIADRCVVTEVDLAVEGDAYAPVLDDRWTVASEGEWLGSTSGLRFRVVTFERVA